MTVSRTLLALTCAVALVGCATANVPASSYSKPREAVRAAEELNAQEDPQAQYHLNLAKEQIERADRLLSAGDEDEAQRFLMQAEADAELALVMAKRQSTRAEVMEAEAKLEQLREEMQ